MKNFSSQRKKKNKNEKEKTKVLRRLARSQSWRL
jgi:hypothetical protein